MYTQKIVGLFALSIAGIMLFTDPSLAAKPNNKINSVASNQNITSLKDTIKSTLTYNPNIKAFQEYRTAAKHDLERSRSGWFPRVDVRGGYGVEQWNDRSTRNAEYIQNHRDFYDRSEGSATISQTIWDGMATWNRVTIGQTRLDSAKSRLFDNAEALALDATLAHIEVYRQRKIVDLAERNVKNHKKILASQKERQASGASTLADVTQIQSRLARTEASLAESRAALEASYANYKKLTGKDPFNLEIPTIANEYPSLDVALAHANSGNLKIKALMSDISSSEAQVKLDKSPFYPQITLEAGPSYRSQVESSNDYSWGTAIMLRANWNLFNGGYDWYNVKGSKARSRQSKQELNALVDNLNQEVTTTWSNLISAQQQEKFFRSGLHYSRQTRDLYLEQFDLGQRSLLDLLDAENELFSVGIQHVTSEMNIIAAKYRLLTLGGDFLSTFGINREELAIRTDY